MTKQKEIMEATRILEDGGCIHIDPSLCQLDGDCCLCYLKFLQDKGVVIKVDRELPELMFVPGFGYMQGHSIQAIMDVAVEPLIEEVSNG